jgi:hypothetical protein
MVRIAISVEGATEERFIQIVLAPYLLIKGIYATPISLNGNISVDRVNRELKHLVHSSDYISTFYDFYGFKHKDDLETKRSLEEKIHIAKEIGLSKLREMCSGFNAWLLRIENLSS